MPVSSDTTQLTNSNNDQLQAAFQLFSEVSSQLEVSYRELELQVEQLNLELAAANSEKLRQLAEKEQLADKLEALLAAMPAAVIWIDREQQVISANAAASSVFNSDIIHRDWLQVLQEHQFTFNGHEFMAPDGLIYSCQQRLLDAGQGEVIILTDVTFSHEIQKTGHRQQRLAELGELTAGLAHQVRTPLASAMLSVEQLSHPSISAELREKSIQRIYQNLHHLDQLMNDMLQFARGGEFDNDLINVSVLFNKLEEHFSLKMNEQFELAIKPGKDNFISGSFDALLSVLISVVDNAILARDTGAVLQVEAEASCQDDTVFITVCDNGPGMSEEQCKQVFKPFYTTRKEGTGLGLAISRSIIRAHQGDIKAFSTPGAGTCMQLSLPLLKNTNLLHSNANKAQ